jgi:hypothetical protein
MVFTDVNKTANTFCVLSVYGLSPGTGDPRRDFSNNWKELVVTPFAAGAEPKTETLPAAEGWTATAGGSLIDMNGIKSAAILTVFTGYGKSASILAIFNDEAYSTQMQALVDSLKLDKSAVSSDPPPVVQNDPAAGAPIEHWVILREFKDNQVAAEAKYNGKRVTIVGPMDMVLVENGMPVIRMGVPAWSGRQMFCIFPVSQKAAVATLKPDQKVVLECTVLGNAGGVSRIGRVDLGSSVGRLTLDDCELK